MRPSGYSQGPVVRRRSFHLFGAKDSGDNAAEDTGNRQDEAKQESDLHDKVANGDETDISVDDNDGFVMSEIASEDLFDDIDFDDDFLFNAGDLDLDDGDGDLDAILAEMEEGDFLILADEDDDDSETVEGGAFVVASEGLDDDALLFADLDELGNGDDDEEFDDDDLMELLGMDDDADPDDLVELERLLTQKRKIDDALDLRRILGPQREVVMEYDSSDTAGAAAASGSELERALLQGVVPADAGVGSGSLPGDFGFDPLELSTKDYFKQTQNFLLGLLPDQDNEDNIGTAETGYDGSAIPNGWRLEDQEERPPALILRDYREAEIRHGRLAMLAAAFWPLQEIADRLFIPNSFGHTTVIYGGPTLPFFSLLMTAIMFLLGYLDIYAAAVKDADVGEAFLPGECFWDPLRMLDGAPDEMKRNMQQRELNNGRMAMVAVAAYILEEAISHRPLVSLPFNEFLFEPAYEIPVVQAWLDQQFQTPSPTFIFPEVGTVDFVETLKEVLEEEQQGAKAAADVATNVAAGLDGVVENAADAFPNNLLQ